MCFNWKLFLSLADELLNHPRTESLQDAYFRTAISRSYYAVFPIALKLAIIKKGGLPPNSNEHKFTRDTFIQSSKVIDKNIGEKIKRLWFERKNADYEDTASIDKNRVEAACILANQTLKLLEKELP